MLDLSRSYGTITPPYQPPGSDRPQAFEQDGVPFDAQGREIVPGKPAESATAPDQGDGNVGMNAQRAALAEKLVAQADRMSLDALRRQAGIALGETAPTKKGEVLDCLKASLTLYRARRATGIRATKAA
jgi:hypothetical protein